MQKDKNGREHWNFGEFSQKQRVLPAMSQCLPQRRALLAGLVTHFVIRVFTHGFNGVYLLTNELVLTDQSVSLTFSNS